MLLRRRTIRRRTCSLDNKQTGKTGESKMPLVTTRDRTGSYVKQWGSGLYAYTGYHEHMPRAA